MSAKAAWNARNTELAKSLWLGGESGTVIGKKIGMTPVAVIGKMHRLGLADRGIQPRQMADIATVMLSNPEIFAEPVGAPDPEPVKAPTPKKAEAKAPEVKAERVAQTALPEKVDPSTAEPVVPEPLPVEAEEIVEAPSAEPAPVLVAAEPPPPVAAPSEPREVALIEIAAPVPQGPLVASDGSAGILFLQSSVSKFQCAYPLWDDRDNVPIEQKRVCGCRVITGKSWCPTHFSKVFDPARGKERIRVPARV